MYIHKALFTARSYLHQDLHSQEHTMKTFVIFLALCLSGARTHKSGTNLFFFFFNKQREFIFICVHSPCNKAMFETFLFILSKNKYKTKMGMQKVTKSAKF